MSKQVVKLEGIQKVFEIGETTFTALHDVNLEIKKGEFVAIVGESGSGKSTLMNILGLLDRPTHGKYLLDGHDASHLSENEKARLRNHKIGFVFQSFNLLPRTSAKENVALPLVYSGVSKKEREKLAVEKLSEVGLPDKTNSHPNQLSGGQQQRVAVARALINDPEIILADEPTGNLDSKTGNEIVKLFIKLNKAGRTIVLITHSEDVAKVAKRTIRIKDGEVVR